MTAIRKTIEVYTKLVRALVMGLAVLGALTLYLNFINLFLLILRARDRNR